MNWEKKLELMEFHINRLIIWIDKAPPKAHMIRFHAKCLEHLNNDHYADYCIYFRDRSNSSDISFMSINFAEEIPEAAIRLSKILNIKLF